MDKKTQFNIWYFVAAVIGLFHCKRFSRRSPTFRGAGIDLVWRHLLPLE
jgi:hypothetical protein